MEHDRTASEAAQVFRATERAMGRAASLVHEDLKQGLNTLATIASIAPLVGTLGTVWAIGFDAFLPVGTERATVLAMDAMGVARACVPTALGLLVGLQSLWIYKYLQGKLANFDLEMTEASLGSVNRLTLYFNRLHPSSPIEGVSHSLPYLESYSPESETDRKYRHRKPGTAKLG